MKTVFLIDMENVIPVDINLVNSDSNLIVFIGDNQSKINADIVLTLQPFGKQVQYLKISGMGKNALDFHIAFYLGKLCLSEPENRYVIISKDSGFDPLIKHISGFDIVCERHASLTNYFS